MSILINRYVALYQTVLLNLNNIKNMKMWVRQYQNVTPIWMWLYQQVMQIAVVSTSSPRREQLPSYHHCHQQHANTQYFLMDWMPRSYHPDNGIKASNTYTPQKYRDSASTRSYRLHPHKKRAPDTLSAAPCWLPAAICAIATPRKLSTQ